MRFKNKSLFLCSLAAVAILFACTTAKKGYEASIQSGSEIAEYILRDVKYPEVPSLDWSEDRSPAAEGAPSSLNPATIKDIYTGAVEIPGNDRDDILSKRNRDNSGYSTFDSRAFLLPNPYDRQALKATDGISDEGLKRVSKTTIKQAEEARAKYYSARAGQEVWMKATAGNTRFHTYTYQQKVGVLIDWYRVMKTDERYGNRFPRWGLMNDPDCCVPGTGECTKKFGREIRPEETFGFDYCPGDDELLKFVGKAGYQDPACRFVDADGQTAQTRNDPNSVLTKTACGLEFGTSSGIVGFRKIPNPRFDAKAWAALGGGFKAYEKMTKEKMWNDHSVEPPFRLGMACAACHVGFNPTNPPADPKRPQWANMLPAIGNIYARVSEIMGSGMPETSLEWQAFTNTRPGTVDTSAVPNDYVNNPGTFNALFNVARRPTFTHKASKIWDFANHKYVDEQRTYTNIMNILKGGEDSVGPAGAVQRVYLNIGVCSEECWTSHFSDNFEMVPSQRGYGQTPFNSQQCRANCPNYNSIEARVGDVYNFFLTLRPNDLKDARFALKDGNATTNVKPNGSPSELKQQVDAHYAKLGVANAVDTGKALFAQNCAQCHSSDYSHKGQLKQFSPTAGDVDGYKKRDYYQTHPEDPSLRLDFLSNDLVSEFTTIGTYKCRSYHSNHMKGHIWDEYGSDTLHTEIRKPASAVFEGRDYGNGIAKLGQAAGRPSNVSYEKYETVEFGPGYYRNVPLINAWAHAPFLHNNSVGPELCGDFTGASSKDNFCRNSYVDNKNGTMNFAPSIEGRIEVYQQSMRQLLTPSAQRPRKHSVTAGPVIIPLGSHVTFEVPKGISITLLGSFRHKDFVADLYEAANKGISGDVSPVIKLINPKILDLFREGAVNLSQSRKIVADPKVVEQVLMAYGNCIATYDPSTGKQSSSAEGVISENWGHDFGVGLKDNEKKALEAFILTL